MGRPVWAESLRRGGKGAEGERERERERGVHVHSRRGDGSLR